MTIDAFEQASKFPLKSRPPTEEKKNKFAQCSLKYIIVCLQD